MLEAEGNETADDGTDARPQIPKANARRLFFLLVPHTSDEDERGRNSRFEDAEEDARSNKGTVCLASSGGSDDGAPEGDHNAQVFGGGKTLHAVAVWEFKGEV